MACTAFQGFWLELYKFSSGFQEARCFLLPLVLLWACLINYVQLLSVFKKKLSTGLQFSKEASAEERRTVCQQALTSGRGAERPRPSPRFTRFHFFLWWVYGISCHATETAGTFLFGLFQTTVRVIFTVYNPVINENKRLYGETD